MLIKVNDIISQSWSYYYKNFKKLLPYILLMFIPTFLLGVSGIILLYLTQFASSIFAIVVNDAVSLIILAVTILFTLWVNLALIKVVAALITKQKLPELKESFSITSHLIWPILYTMLLVGLIIIGGTFLLIIPGFIFFIWYSFVYFIVVIEEKKGADALSASKDLVTNRWWSILIRLALPHLFFALIFVAINAPFTVLFYKIFGGQNLGYFLTSGIVNNAFTALFTPITTFTVVLLYFSAKNNPAKKKEEIEK